MRVQFIGTQRCYGRRIRPWKPTKCIATIKGPASEMTADLFFAKDADRTPLLVQVPLAMGKFSMELVR